MKKRIVSFSILIFLFLLVQSMSNYISLGANNFTGQTGATCEMCHGNDADSVGIFFWQPDGACYTPDTTYFLGIHLRDSAQATDFAGIQLTTVNVGNPNPASNSILGSTGFFAKTTVNGQDIHTTEQPQWLGHGVTYPASTFNYGTNLVVQYWIDPAAVDTLELFIAAVFTNKDNTMFNDKVASAHVKIGPCVQLGFNNNPVIDPTIPANPLQLNNNWNFLGQKGVQSPFSIQYLPKSNSYRKIVIIQ